MTPHTCTGPGCFGCKVKTVQFAATPAFQPHYNWSVGAYVENDKAYRDELKRASERNCVATGIDHDYQPRYPGDLPAGDTTSTEKLLHDSAVKERLVDPCRPL